MSLAGLALGRGTAFGQNRPRPALDVSVGYGTTRNRLAAADFTYIGSFRLQIDDLIYGGMGMGWYPAGNGGSGTLLLAGNNGASRNSIVEVAPATPTMSPTRNATDLPNATRVQTLADPTGGLCVNGTHWLRGVSAIRLPNGQYKFAWGFSTYFNAGAGSVYGLGYCDPDGRNPKGGWRLSGVNCQRASANLSVVPQAWADANIGGRSIVAGGMDFQIVGGSCGGHSAFFWAPWVDDPVAYAPAPNTDLSVRTGCDFPMTSYQNPSGQQMAFPDELVTLGWKPAGCNFYWQTDTHGGLQYVTTKDGRSGFVCPGTINGVFSSYDVNTLGYVVFDNTKAGDFPHGVWPDGTMLYYNGAPIHGQVSGLARCGLFFYDPPDYLAVIAGTKPKYAVKAYAWKNIYNDLSLNGTVGTYDGGTSPHGGPNNNWNYEGTWAFNGSAYDPVTRRLYVLHQKFFSTGGTMAYPGVHVFQVN